MSYFLWGCRGILTLITLRSERVKTTSWRHLWRNAYVSDACCQREWHRTKKMEAMTCCHESTDCGLSPTCFAGVAVGLVEPPQDVANLALRAAHTALQDFAEFGGSCSTEFGLRMGNAAEEDPEPQLRHLYPLAVVLAQVPHVQRLKELVDCVHELRIAPKKIGIDSGS